jgi:peptide deformylase
MSAIIKSSRFRIVERPRNVVRALNEFTGCVMPRKIVHYPHPALRHKSKPVTSVDKQLHLHIGEMKELMYQAKGLGLAAPQVALPVQLLVMNVTGDPAQPEREEVYLNPQIVERKGVMEDEEGCLSFPGLYQNVRRAQTIKVRAYNLQGKLVEKVISDLESRAWQHEIDHLNGILFIDMMGPLARFAARSSVKNFEKVFREAQKKGELPPDFEIEKLLAALESQH